MLYDFILGDNIALGMEMPILQMLIGEMCEDRAQITFTRTHWHIPDSCPARHSRDDHEPSYTSPPHNLARVRGRETKPRSGRYVGTPSVERKQRSGGGNPGWDTDTPM